MSADEDSKSEKSSGLSTRTVVLVWVGVVLLLVLGLYAGLLVGSIIETRSTVRGLAYRSWSLSLDGRESPPEAAIRRLGGSEQAARRLALYLRLPKWAGGAKKKDYRWAAVMLLGYCGPPAVPALKEVLGDEDGGGRSQAAKSLGRIRPAAKDAVLALVNALEDKDMYVRRSAAWALCSIGPPAKEAAPALEKLRRDSDADVRAAAAEALNKIRGEGEQE